MLDVVAAEEVDAAATAEEETDADATEEELYEMLATEAANDDETAEEEVGTVDEVKTAEEEDTYCDEVATAVLVPKRFSGAGVGMAISLAAS